MCTGSKQEMDELEDKFLEGCYTPDCFVGEVELEQPPVKKARKGDEENASNEKTGGSSNVTEKGKSKKTETKKPRGSSIVSEKGKSKKTETKKQKGIGIEL